MIKIFLRFAGYIFLKWVCFYIYQIAESKRYWEWSRVWEWEDIFYTIWIIIALPILEILILFFPFQIALKQRGLMAISLLFLCFALEFIIGWFATNQHLEIWMIVKIILSITLFFLIYRKQLEMRSNVPG